MSMYVRIIRTRRPHWGSYSGFNQFLKYVDPEKYCVSVHFSSDGDQDFPIRSRRIQEWLRNRVQRKGMKYYKLSDLAAEIRTLGRCCKGVVDVVHYIDAEHGAQYLPRMLKTCGLRTKTMATYHQPPELLERLVRKEVIARLDFVTVVSPEQMSYFKGVFPPEKVRLILHGIDCDFFKPGTGPQDDVFKCITAGHWLRDFDTVRKVAEKLQSHKEIEFVVVDSHRTGPWQIGLEGMPNVRLYRDHVEDSEFVRLYQQSNVLFLPLLGSTANNALLEGIACGLPVLSTMLPSVKVYVPGGEAILLKDNDPDQFADAILNLVRSPETREAMARKARARAEELDWRRISPQFEHIYSELAEE